MVFPRVFKAVSTFIALSPADDLSFIVLPVLGKKDGGSSHAILFLGGEGQKNKIAKLPCCLFYFFREDGCGLSSWECGALLKFACGRGGGGGGDEEEEGGGGGGGGELGQGR